MLLMKYTRMFHVRNYVVHVRTLWSQKVVSNVWLQEEVAKLDGLPHAFRKMYFVLHFV